LSSLPAVSQRFPRPLYPSLYIALVAPPRLCAKSTAIRIALSLLEQVPAHLEHDPILQCLKRANILHSKATPESFSALLEPTTERVIVDEEHIETVKRYPQLCMGISELTTLLGRQQYNSGLIDRLTDLYDNAVTDDVTLGRGAKIFRDSYITLIGGTQEEKLQKSLPPEAVGGGFLSRLLLIVEELGTRCYRHPKKVLEGPSEEELSRRLAWIAENSRGEYVLTPEADELYGTWYMKFHDELVKTTNTRVRDMKCRIDVHLLKTAMLVRAQRYERGKEITAEDFIAAKTLLEETYKPGVETVENIGASEDYRYYTLLRNWIRSKKQCTRRQLIKRMSALQCPAALAGKLVYQLYQEGKIKIRRGGEDKNTVTARGSEIYRWSG